MIEDEFDGCVGSGELVPFVLNDGCDVSLKYIFYLLRSIYLSKQIEYSLSGCSRMRISTTEMRNLLIPLPKNKIEEKKITRLIENKINLAILALAEYKSNLKKSINTYEEELNKLIIE